MSLDATKVVVGSTGGIYYAPTGTTLPTVATSTLDALFTANEVGYLSENGITQTISSDSTSIKAWQNAAEVRVISTGSSVQYGAELMEVNANSLEAYYGNYTALADGASVEINANALPRLSWVLHVIDDAKKIRIVIPDGQITERGETQFVNSEAYVMPITITAYPDGSGNNAYMYIDESILTSS